MLDFTNTTRDNNENDDDDEEEEEDLVHLFPLSGTLVVLREITALLAITQCAPMA